MMTEDQRLIYEALLIVTGQTNKLPSMQHLRALLEERTDMIDALYQAKDGLADAAGMDEEWRKAALQACIYNLKSFEFLEKIDKEWAEKVVLHDVDVREKTLREVL